MDVILHVGAHRCATTTFQSYMRRNAGLLAEGGIAFWGPIRTRSGLFRGLLPGPGRAFGRDPRRRALGRVKLALLRAEAQGARRLVVSDENMLGSIRANLAGATLYADAGERMARHAEAFDGRIREVILNIRSPEFYWASAMGFALARGLPLPGGANADRIAGQARGWRAVIADLACAVPGACIRVLPFEIFAGHPDAQLAAVVGGPAPTHAGRDRLNATPRLAELRRLCPLAGLPPEDGRWMPFSARQAQALRDSYAADLAWLAAGADGLAQLVRDPGKKTAGRHPPRQDKTRGRPNDQDRRLAGAR